MELSEKISEEKKENIQTKQLAGFDNTTKLTSN